MVGVLHFLMTTPNSTISEPYKHLRMAKALMVWQMAKRAKASFLGVVGFGGFVPDSGSGSVTILTAIVNLP